MPDLHGRIRRSQLDAYLLPQLLVSWLRAYMPIFVGYGLTYIGALLLRRLATWFDVRTNSESGYSRIARGVPWAGSVTGGEACGYPCSEKEGFTHPPLWRAPCFWGTYESKLHAVDT